MAGPNLPSMTELAQMEFMSPMMFNQGQQQIGLANQFAQQGLESGALNNQAQTLANQFAEQMNPLRVDQQTLNNEGIGFDNMSKGVKARTDVELEDEEKKARRQKLLAQASDDDLKALQAQAEAQMLHPDPAIREVGRKKLEGSWAETQRRLKAADDLKKTEMIVGGRQSVAETNAGARTESAEIAAEGRRDAAKAKTANTADFETLMMKYGNNPVKAAELRAQRGEALLMNGDAEGAQRQFALAAQARQRAAEDATNKGLATPSIDIPSVANLPARPSPTAGAPVGLPPAQFTTNGNEATSVRNAMGGIMNGPQTETRRAAVDVQAVEAELAKTKNPEVRRVLQEQLDKERAYLKQQMGNKAPVPAAPAGRVIIYKDGKPVGSVPQAQADAAVKQGYSLK